MSRLGDNLELFKLFLQQKDALYAENADRMRDAVFAFSEDLRDVKRIAAKNSTLGFVRAESLKKNIEIVARLDSPGMWRFEDKKRLSAVRRACAQLARDCGDRLTPDEREKALRCVDHLDSRENLLKLVQAREEKDALEASGQSTQARLAAYNTEYEAIREQQAKINGIGCVAKMSRRRNCGIFLTRNI